MFTGIITHIGTVARIRKQGDWTLVIAASGFTQDLKRGASVACSGVCLTVTDKTARDFTVQASAETLSRTTVGQWQKGSRINLERALRMGDELGGHLVSGHVDALATLEKKKKAADSWVLTFSAPHALRHYIAPKGSVTLDGVSLTVNEVAKNAFTVNIIPHTLLATTLGALAAGDAVNLEIDLIARYLARMKEK